jgi:hypothetical protein
MKAREVKVSVCACLIIAPTILDDNDLDLAGKQIKNRNIVYHQHQT